MRIGIKTKQIWQYVIHERDKPKRVHTKSYNINQDPEILYQRARGLLLPWMKKKILRLLT